MIPIEQQSFFKNVNLLKQELSPCLKKKGGGMKTELSYTQIYKCEIHI